MSFICNILEESEDYLNLLQDAESVSNILPEPDDYPSFPEGVKSGKFSINDRGLMYDYIERASLEQLKKQKNNANKYWIIAQLLLYGIPFKKSDSAANLRAILSDAVYRKKSLEPTPELKAFEASLAKKHDQQQREYKQTVKDWEVKQFSKLSSPADEADNNTGLFLAKYFLKDGQPDKTKQKDALTLERLSMVAADSLKRAVSSIPGLDVYAKNFIVVIGWENTFGKGIQQAFTKEPQLATKWAFDVPTEEAEFSIRHFMAKYFLREGTDDVPDQTKSAKPLEISCYSKDGQTRLLEAVEAIPGLHAALESPDLDTGRFFLRKRAMFIGWDLEAVRKSAQDKEASEKAKRAAREAQEAAEEKAIEEAERARFFKPHTDFMKTYTPSQGPLTLNDLTGSFIAYSKDMDEYDCEKTLPLDIHPPSEPNSHGVIAAFYLGLVKGTMLLSLNRDSLDTFAEEMSHPDPDSSDYESEDASNAYNFAGDNNKKGKQKTNGAHPAIKRRLGGSSSVPNPNRVYFRWAGISCPEPGLEGMIDEVDNAGYIDFEPSKAVGKGQWVMDRWFGKEKKLDLQVYKASAQPCEEVSTPWRYFQDPKYYTIYTKW